MRKRMFHGDFRVIKGTKKIPAGQTVRADLYAYNYIHYRIKVWLKYGKTDMIYFAEIPQSLSLKVITVNS